MLAPGNTLDAQFRLGVRQQGGWTSSLSISPVPPEINEGGTGE